MLSSADSGEDLTGFSPVLEDWAIPFIHRTKSAKNTTILKLLSIQII